MGAISKSEPAKKDAPVNSLRDGMKGKGPDTSVAAYRAYVIEAQTNGETPMSLEEFKRSRTKNSLK